MPRPSKIQSWFPWILVLSILAILIVGIMRGRETPEERTARFQQYREIEYERAVRCSGTPNARVRFDEIQWAITPGDELVYAAQDGTAVLAGWADTSQNLIYLPEDNQGKRWILRHEILHLLGYVGHPDHPFKTCRAMPEQN